MTDAAQWERIESVVRKVIHGWDPYQLLQSGAPEDEWDGEILQIVGRVNRIHSTDDATAVVSEVFTAAFQAEGFAQADCREVGAKLFNALKDTGLIQTAQQARELR
jgi:hypothetical protein